MRERMHLAEGIVVTYKQAQQVPVHALSGGLHFHNDLISLSDLQVSSAIPT